MLPSKFHIPVIDHRLPCCQSETIIDKTLYHNKLKFVFHGVENIERKGENAAFSHFPKMFFFK